MKDVKIERMQLVHIPEVVEIEKLCFTNPWSKQSFYYEIAENPRALYLVALFENKVIGYIGNWIICDEGHITNLAVHPGFQRRGLGEALIKALINIGKLHHINHYTLEVRVSNIAAQKLYKKLGFEEAGIRKKYYQDNMEDALIMWKHI